MLLNVDEKEELNQIGPRQPRTQSKLKRILERSDSSFDVFVMIYRTWNCVEGKVSA